MEPEIPKKGGLWIEEILELDCGELENLANNLLDFIGGSTEGFIEEDDDDYLAAAFRNYEMRIGCDSITFRRAQNEEEEED